MKEEVTSSGRHMRLDPDVAGETPKSGTSSQPPRHLHHPQHSVVHGIAEWIGIILAALAAALLLRTFAVQTFWIPSASMEKTLMIQDHVLVNKFSYRISDVHRGDIVVFEPPPTEPDPTIKDLIKRVVALPGETIEARNGIVVVNGRAIPEPYLQPGVITTNLPKTVLAQDSYYVLGDNRSNSADSRRIGPISRSLIVGKAEVKIWPLSRVGGL